MKDIIQDFMLFEEAFIKSSKGVKFKKKQIKAIGKAFSKYQIKRDGLGN